MKQDVFPVGQGARKRRSQWLAFGIFKLLSYSIVLILFAILGFIIYRYRSNQLGVSDHGAQ